jgi:hypothetical protein
MRSKELTSLTENSTLYLLGAFVMLAGLIFGIGLLEFHVENKITTATFNTESSIISQQETEYKNEYQNFISTFDNAFNSIENQKVIGIVHEDGNPLHNVPTSNVELKVLTSKQVYNVWTNSAGTILRISVAPH